jgi:hypothetical protein
MEEHLLDALPLLSGLQPAQIVLTHLHEFGARQWISGMTSMFNRSAQNFEMSANLSVASLEIGNGVLL